MNPTTSEVPPLFPTAWRVVDEVNKIECRQHSDDTFELRSAHSTLIVNKEGFDLYRDDTEEGRSIFEKWLKDNNIKPAARWFDS